MTGVSLRSWIVALPVAAACSGGGTGSSTVSPDDVITAEEIRAESWNWANTFEVVPRLRPEWLEPPEEYGFTEPGELVIYLDDVRMGGPAQPQEIPSQLVASIRYYDPSTGRRQFGLDHRGGAIFVATH